MIARRRQVSSPALETERLLAAGRAFMIEETERDGQE
jgi:hypothetical protein